MSKQLSKIDIIKKFMDVYIPKNFPNGVPSDMELLIRLIKDKFTTPQKIENFLKSEKLASLGK